MFLHLHSFSIISSQVFVDDFLRDLGFKLTVLQETFSVSHLPITNVVEPRIGTKKT